MKETLIIEVEVKCISDDETSRKLMISSIKEKLNKSKMMCTSGLYSWKIDKVRSIRTNQ